MINYNSGDIILLRFPHSEGTEESRRPALILAQTDDLDIIVAKITSSEKRSDYDIVINDWKETGLLFPSVIRMDKIATLSRSRVLKKLGRLNLVYESMIKDKIKQLFSI